MMGVLREVGRQMMLPSTLSHTPTPFHYTHTASHPHSSRPFTPRTCTPADMSAVAARWFLSLSWSSTLSPAARIHSRSASALLRAAAPVRTARSRICSAPMPYICDGSSSRVRGSRGSSRGSSGEAAAAGSSRIAAAAAARSGGEAAAAGSSRIAVALAAAAAGSGGEAAAAGQAV